jgi:hypothetical protein
MAVLLKPMDYTTEDIEGASLSSVPRTGLALTPVSATC